jgi:hypothetical protein
MHFPSMVFTAVLAGFELLLVPVFILLGDWGLGVLILGFLILAALMLFTTHYTLLQGQVQARTLGFAYRRMPLDEIVLVRPGRRFGGWAFVPLPGWWLESSNTKFFLPVDDVEAFRDLLLESAPQLRRYGEELRGLPEPHA